MQRKGKERGEKKKEKKRKYMIWIIPSSNQTNGKERWGLVRDMARRGRREADDVRQGTWEI
jgi:hypothetical protein